MISEDTPVIEPATDVETRTYRVLRKDGRTTWVELEQIVVPYIADAIQIGEKYGEGDYLLIETDSKYSFHTTYPMRVVAEKRYREANEVS